MGPELGCRLGEGAEARLLAAAALGYGLLQLADLLLLGLCDAGAEGILPYHDPDDSTSPWRPPGGTVAKQRAGWAPGHILHLACGIVSPGLSGQPGPALILLTVRNINICKSGEDITALLLPGAYYNYDLSGESLTRGKDVYLPVRRTLAEISQDEKFRQAARGALYANAIKTLTGLASQDIQIEELGFAHEFYGCHACPVSEKMLVALRRVLLLIRGTLHLQTKHVKFRTRND